MAKDDRKGGKQMHGNSRKSYFARRKFGLAKANKEKRVFKDMKNKERRY